MVAIAGECGWGLDWKTGNGSCDKQRSSACMEARPPTSPQLPSPTHTSPGSLGMSSHTVCPWNISRLRSPSST